MFERLGKQELESRIERLHAAFNRADSGWDTALIINRITQYYLTGTMQDGVFVLKKDGSYTYFARRSYERALKESPLDNIFSMESYRDVAAVIGAKLGNTYIDTETVTIAMLDRLKKHLSMDTVISADRIIQGVRAVKSPYELYWMMESGKQHKYLLEDVVPGLLRPGVSEAEFTAELYEKMVKLGYHGVSRFSMFQTEVVAGQIGFGDNSLFPTSFDGPGGMRGQNAAVPVIGSRERRLRRGDLVFVDIGYGVNGYHSDKTQVYMYGEEPCDEIMRAHRRCIEIQRKAAGMLKPGSVPSDIYNNVINQIETEFLDNFMGFGVRKVKFLGHGIGLQIDELPVIANGFSEPLAESTVIAIEPKKGLAGIGMVGVEDTYIVTPEGGKCITGGGTDIIRV